VDLCGHATLASAHVLFNHLGYSEEQIVFSTVSGELRVTRENSRLILDFPATPPSPAEIKEELIQGLGMRPTEVHKSRDYLAVYGNESDILSLKPDFDILRKLDCLGIIVSAKGENCDFVSRFFAPAAGVDEDPVTGSAHTTLIPFWAERLKKTRLHAFQLSRRKGELFCEFAGDRVKIGGHAVTFFVGEISI
jgi:PhzF family phenazine biosynthesis protein